MSEPEAITDVVELCALLQCLGFTVKSLDTSDVNLSQDGGTKSIVVNCQSSGLHVVLESPTVACSCPVAEQNSGFWQVSGMAGGKQHDKETGSSILRSIPKIYRDEMAKELHKMVRNIRALNDSEACPKPVNKSASMIELEKQSSLVDLSKEGNKSASILEMATPEKRHLQQRAETPTRFRSLDALTSSKEGEPLRLLQKQYILPDSDDPTKTAMCRRQSTYTVSSTPPGSVRRRNKTSSPIQPPQNNVLENLMEAEKAAEGLRMKITSVIRELMDEKHDSSISSMLDVSKISVLKGAESSKAQFASSPNLSGIGTLQNDLTKSRLKRFESASTSNLAKSTPESKISKLRKISPSMFRMNKDGAKDKPDGKSKLQSLFRPKIVTPVRSGKPAEPSPNLSSVNKKKFSHIKSTIPRPTPKKE